MSEDPSAGIEVTVTPFMDDIGALDLKEFATAFVRADFDCSCKSELFTDAENAVPALVKDASTKLTSIPYVAAAADAACPRVSPALKSICSLILKLRVCFSPVEVVVCLTSPSTNGSAVAVFVAPPVTTD